MKNKYKVNDVFTSVGSGSSRTCAVRLMLAAAARGLPLFNAFNVRCSALYADFLLLRKTTSKYKSALSQQQKRQPRH